MRKEIIITIIIISAMLLGLWLSFAYEVFLLNSQISTQEMRNLIDQEQMLSEVEKMMLIEGNSLIAVSAPNYVSPQTLGMLILADKIIACESVGDPKVCNKEFGCRAGMGLWMFISGTWNETLDRMEEVGAHLPERCWEKVQLPVSEERTEAVFDAECNFLAGLWLLETDGDIHWRPYSGSCYLKD